MTAHAASTLNWRYVFPADMHDIQYYHFLSRSLSFAQRPSLANPGRESAQGPHPIRKGQQRAMGRRNYLISGVSGAGKTAVCTELQRRGYQAIHGDSELAYQGDPDTGQPTDGLKHEHS